MAFADSNAMYGYLPYDQIQDRIDKGELGPYSFAFSSDRHGIHFVTPEKTILDVRSRIYIYQSTSEANTSLNANEDTYAGQIVAIGDGINYHGYIVNQQSDGTFYVSGLSSSGSYDDLTEIPIKNLDSSSSAPADITALNNGIYKVSYITVPGTSDTLYSEAGHIIIVDSRGIKRISSNYIYDYRLVSGSYVSTQYITKDFLDEQGFATTNYVDDKIAALDFITKDEAAAYIQAIFEAEAETVVEEKINEMFIPATEQEIEEVFS